MPETEIRFILSNSKSFATTLSNRSILNSIPHSILQPQHQLET